ncbi:MAG: SdrD B-like domain-containing protein, partial [Pirellulaceae bacterium]
MGWFSKLLSKSRRRRSLAKQRAVRGEVHLERHCAFEVMEPRRMLSASPLTLGTIYIEEDLGSDLHGDRFEVQFAGGAADTELTRLVINGDRGAPGFSMGDVIFDTLPTGYGADAAAGFHVEQLTASNPNAHVEAHVNDGESLLTLDLYGFRAGDKLVFSIDVDEVQFFETSETDVQKINDGIDPITSGVEFQGSQVVASFTAPHYRDAEGNGLFWNRYNDALTTSGLDLSEDNIDGKRDRTAGAFLSVQQVVRPAALSGYVYADDNNDGLRGTGERGLAGVTVQIIPVDTLAPQQTVNLITNAQGFYEATNLSPGTYRIIEVQQPAAYLDGLDTAGTVDGVGRGTAVNPGDNIENVFLGGGTRGVEYNFGEILPASLRGSVHLSDADGDCFTTMCTHEALSGVTVKLLDSRGQVLAETQTDVDGNYAFAGLVPGLYSIIEVTPVGMIDAGAHAGTVGNNVRGRVVDANTIADVQLRAGDEGYEYDFCEHLPSSLAGYVYHDRNSNGLRENGEEAIPGVTVTLYGQGGLPVAVTQTNAQGYYQFAALSAGMYRLVESQPSDWLDGQDTTGTINGTPAGTVAGNDILQVGQLPWGATGVNYNFGELLPGTLQGVVHADLDGDGVFDPNERPIVGVKIELLDEHGSVLVTTATDTAGAYRFEHLVPGQYAVRETQPDGYFQGGQRAGSHGGNASVTDLITQIPLGSDDHLTNYDFCEIPPGSISGIVFVDPSQNRNWDSGETLLPGVTVQLLDATGSVVATTQTSTVGYYEFKNLRPGEYGVHELQPPGFLQGGQSAGSGGGIDTVPDLISTISVLPAAQLLHYNFHEIPPGTLSGYVFQDGETIRTTDGAVPANLADLRDGRRTADDRPIAGVVVELRDGRTGIPILADQALPGAYPSGPLQAVTDAQGYYQFVGLPPGNYAVYEVHPARYRDGIDTAGTTSGIPFNVDSPQLRDLIRQLAKHPANDAIVQIPLLAGQSSLENNFSEVLVVRITPPPEEPLQNPP